MEGFEKLRYIVVEVTWSTCPLEIYEKVRWKVVEGQGRWSTWPLQDCEKGRLGGLDIVRR